MVYVFVCVFVCVGVCASLNERMRLENPRVCVRERVRVEESL